MNADEKLKAMIILYKGLSKDNQDLLRSFVSTYQKQLDKLEEEKNVLRDQLIKIRNSSY
jgi:hypothetical protein|tara:strand:+ start:834 stop:1010 length:177 start_codon:yes stop_codon:yes gene_type:complete